MGRPPQSIVGIAYQIQRMLLPPAQHFDVTCSMQCGMLVGNDHGKKEICRKGIVNRQSSPRVVD